MLSTKMELLWVLPVIAKRMIIATPCWYNGWVVHNLSLVASKLDWCETRERYLPRVCLVWLENWSCQGKNFWRRSTRGVSVGAMC
jgi:hypothetical protein